jgi:hypothetical protein
MRHNQFSHLTEEEFMARIGRLTIPDHFENFDMYMVRGLS